MNTNEAKFILQARRPDGRDDAQPPFSEALAQAARDPLLAGWLAREQAFDTAVVARLREVGPPPGLRDAILAGVRMQRPVSWWQRTLPVALAASVALILGLAASWSFVRAKPDAEKLVSLVMAEFVSPAHAPMVLGGSGTLKTLLADTRYRLSEGLRLDFAQLKADGCRSLTIGGRELLEICFMREGAGEMHLYIAKTDDFEAADAFKKPVFREQGNLASVAWADSRHTYVLVSDAGMDALHAVL